jgi:peptidoglycan/LPS O-acetylase OafA/YrhL
MTSDDRQRAAWRFGHQPALDGVRAVAITLVVLCHYPWGAKHYGGSLPFHGGGLGVEVFFVLSGFLITTLLLQEYRSHGSVSIRAFYARRAFRLLPALAVLLAVVSLMYLADDPKAPTLGGIFGIAFYVANWVQIHGVHGIGGGPLGIAGAAWSLAVEEQFYILWPIVLLLLLRGRLRLRAIALVTSIGIVASAAWCAWLWHRGLAPPNANPWVSVHLRVVTWYRVYYGSDTGADALLVGCLTAILAFVLIPRLGSNARKSLSVAGVLALFACAVMINNANEFHSDWLPEWGFLAFAATVAIVIAALVVSPRSPVSRTFALAPLVWIGRRSYAIYLFHLLVLNYCNREYVHLPPQLSFVFQMTVILVLAELSFRLVEAPMLRRKRRFEVSVPPRQEAGQQSAIAIAG